MATKRATAASGPQEPAAHVGRTGRIAEADTAQRETELLAAARALFYAGGFEGTSIETIARTARVSPKTIYARFGGKSGLFAAALHERADLVLAPLTTPIGDIAHARSALIEFATRLLTLTTLEETLAMQRVIISEAHRQPAIAEAFLEAGPNRGVRTVADFLRRAMEAGVFAERDPHLCAEIFSGALLGVPVRHALLARRRPTRPAIARRAVGVVDFFMLAMRREP